MAKKEVKKFKVPVSVAARLRALEANPERKDKCFSFDRTRKHHDATLFGASQRKVTLCNAHCVEMRKFLDDCKKEVTCGKKNGLTDENAAEPFTFHLCIKLSTWFLENGMMCGWAFLCFFGIAWQDQQT